MKIVAVFHPRERLRKCTLWPLVERGVVSVCGYRDVAGYDWSGCVLLAPGGEPLGPADAGRTIVIVDSTWRYSTKVANLIHAPRRSLCGFVTAYPRTSKLFRDPPGGLASAEAVFAARLVMGERDDSCLDTYRWKEDFLRINARLIAEVAAGTRRDCGNGATPESGPGAGTAG